MRQARFLPLRWRGLLGILPACALVIAGWGCQQPPCYVYYGYGVPPCAPAVPAPSTASSGVVCDVPSPNVDGGPSTTVVASPAPPRIVVSEPVERPRLSWRRTDPDASLATTSVEGAVSDSAVNR
jgi:hypothetical protein